MLSKKTCNREVVGSNPGARYEMEYNQIIILKKRNELKAAKWGTLIFLKI